MSDDTIPLPRPTALSQPYWDACREGRLLVQRCADCGACVFIPQARCTTCQSDKLEWSECSGRGTVYSFTVVHRAPRPQFETPLTVAIVELDEGWYTLTNIIDCPPESVRVGMAVKVDFRRMSDEITLPYFVPA